MDQEKFSLEVVLFDDRKLTFWLWSVIESPVYVKITVKLYNQTKLAKKSFTLKVKLTFDIC